jgi:hypothetical protein
MKEKILFSLFVVIIIILTTYISMLPPRGVNTIEFETVARGQYSGISEKNTFVINTEEEWVSFLNKFKSDEEENGLENVTFKEETDTFVAVTMYENQTTGYGIEIREIYNFPNYLKLDIYQEIPCAGCILESKITRPFHIIKLSKTNKEIRR